MYNLDFSQTKFDTDFNLGHSLIVPHGEACTDKKRDVLLRWPNTVFKCLCVIHHNF